MIDHVPDQTKACLLYTSQIHAVAPVQIGDVLLRDAAGTGADIVATKNTVSYTHLDVYKRQSQSGASGRAASPTAS